MAASKTGGDQFDRLKQEIGRGTRVVSISGLTSAAARANIVARLQAETSRPLAVITDTNDDADRWADDLGFWSDAPFVLLPSFETDPYSSVSPHAETEERRALALWQLAQNSTRTIVLPARSLIQRTVAPN